MLINFLNVIFFLFSFRLHKIFLVILIPKGIKDQTHTTKGETKKTYTPTHTHKNSYTHTHTHHAARKGSFSARKFLCLNNPKILFSLVDRDETSRVWDSAHSVCLVAALRDKGMGQWIEKLIFPQSVSNNILIHVIFIYEIKNI